MASYLNQHIDKRPILEKYLASNIALGSIEVDMTRDLEINMNAMEVDDVADIDYSSFPNLERMHQLISGGSASETLRRNISQFGRNEQPHVENLEEYFEKQASSPLRVNSIGIFPQVRLALVMQVRIWLVIQKFVKLCNFVQLCIPLLRANPCLISISSYWNLLIINQQTKPQIHS